MTIPDRPTIVCLCGSTRFSDAFREANLRETLAGRIVLSIGCDFKSDQALGLTQDDKERLDELHLRKIDLADEVLILNVNGYIGESTAREIIYANEQGKRLRWLEEGNVIPITWGVSEDGVPEDEYDEEEDEIEGDGSHLHQCPYCYDQVYEDHEEFCLLNPGRNRNIIP